MDEVASPRVHSHLQFVFFGPSHCGKVFFSPFLHCCPWFVLFTMPTGMNQGLKTNVTWSHEELFFFLDMAYENLSAF